LPPPVCDAVDFVLMPRFGVRFGVRVGAGPGVGMSMSTWLSALREGQGAGAKQREA
jgi:hypothetical protein